MQAITGLLTAAILIVASGGCDSAAGESDEDGESWQQLAELTGPVLQTTMGDMGSGDVDALTATDSHLVATGDCPEGGLIWRYDGSEWEAVENKLGDIDTVWAG